MCSFRKVALSLASAALAVEPLGRRPHIVFMVADDLGYNDVSFHGSEQIPTPNLDRLAANGVELRNYYVQPVCSPTRATFMTGRHVIHTGVYEPDCGPQNTKAVRPEFTMLPAHLKKLGYETHAVGKWHLGSYSSAVVPTARGFDTFYGYYSGDEDYYTHVNNGFRDHHDDVGDRLRPISSTDGIYSTFLYAARAEKIIAEFAARKQNAVQSKTSLFLYLAWQAIHTPVEVPALYSNKFEDTIRVIGRRTVAGMVSALDEAIGNVTRALRKAGLWEDTLLVFTTDNGGIGAGIHGAWGSNWPLRGMKFTLWEGGVRGVALVHGAGLKKSGYVNHELYHAADWMPSLLSLATNGLEIDSNDATWKNWTGILPLSEPPFELGDGMDVWESLSTGAPSPRNEVLLEAHRPGHDDGNGQAIRVGDYKLVLEKGPGWHRVQADLWFTSASAPQKYDHVIHCGGPPPDESAADYCHPNKLPCLFNVREDPCEYHDLSKTHPEKMAELTRRLAAYQRTAVPSSFHELPDCGASPKAVARRNHDTWMPFCPRPTESEPSLVV